MIFKIYSFPVLWLHCLSVFSLDLASGGHSLVVVHSFSLWWLLLSCSPGTRAHWLQKIHLLGSTAPEQKLRLMGLDALGHLPGPGMEPVHPTFAGTFLATILLGNSSTLSYSSSKKIKSNQAENNIQISSHLYKTCIEKWVALPMGKW